MTLHLPMQFSVATSSSSSSPSLLPRIKIKPKPTSILTTKSLKIPTKSTKPTQSLNPIRATTEEDQQQNPEKTDDEQPQPNGGDDVSSSDIGAEIKKAMAERAEKDGGGFWGGVAEEVGEIEWPPLNKVVGTTGVVLGVIAGSSVALLTVNAILAELSDKVFAGRGVQDFFG